MEADWVDVRTKLEHLVNKIVDAKKDYEQENALALQVEKEGVIEAERMQNPLYVTLKAQKDERDHFMHLYNSGLL